MFMAMRASKYKMSNRICWIFSLTLSVGLLALLSLIAQHLLTRRQQSFPTMIPPPDSKLHARCRWRFGSTAKFCKALVRYPKKNTGCKKNAATKSCRGKYEMFGQFNQDFYLYTEHFSKLRRRGIYVDLGSGHPWKSSNTFFMDKCLGWTGLCIDANRQYRDTVLRDRKCEVVSQCVSEHDGMKERFVFDTEYSGVQHSNKNNDAWVRMGKQLSERSVRCRSLAKLLDEYHIRFIDYLSLDVQGHELYVLRGVDWGKTRIDVMSVGVTPTTRQHIEEFLLPKGYVRHTPDLDESSEVNDVLGEDAIYLHKSVTFGSPE